MLACRCWALGSRTGRYVLMSTGASAGSLTMSPSREDSTTCSMATPWPYSAKIADTASTASGSAVVASSSHSSSGMRCDSDHPLVAAVDRDLRARGPGEQRTAQLGGQLGHVAAGHLDPQHVVSAVVLNTQTVARRPSTQDLLGPDARVEDGV